MNAFRFFRTSTRNFTRNQKTQNALGTKQWWKFGVATTIVVGAGLYSFTGSSLAEEQKAPYTLPKLPYPKDGLEPHISKETVEYHYEKHHRGYVDKLNDIAKGTSLAEKTIEQIILTEKGKPTNLAGQIWNHTFYWNSMSSKGGGKPSGKLLKAIEESFGSYDEFRKQFTNVATNHFGSGWAWLVREKNSNKLSIVETHDAGNPLTQDKQPLLTCDVWEHAYYIDKRNNRGAYIESWWNLVDWEAVEKRLK